MAKLSQEQIEYLLLDAPVIIGQDYGFNKLTELHNEWIREMVLGNKDYTLQAHRGSYKTTCVSVALAVLCVSFPNDKILFMRKTDDDVKEIVSQTKKILLSETMQSIVYSLHGSPLMLTTDNANEINTSLTTDPRGTSQIVAMGIGASLTGKHFDRVFTDDIVNVKDRISRAERERTKLFYQELQNIKNRGGRIFNTGTPWHKDDCFKIMPDPVRYDCYSTDLINRDELDEIRDKMAPSLFAANYELRHIASEDVIFWNPQTGGDPAKAEQGTSHIDAAYGGEDYTAFTIVSKVNETELDPNGNKTTKKRYYVLGRLWQKHIDDVEDQIIALRKSFMAGMIYCEDNGDKGYLARDLRKKGEIVRKYHENMNKNLKITSFLKAVWKDVVFVSGTDEEYINMICDYNINAEHDDAPDSLASCIRILERKGDNGSDYIPLWN